MNGQRVATIDDLSVLVDEINGLKDRITKLEKRPQFVANLESG